MTQPCTDVLIIGAGLAGMAAALSLPPHLRVALLSKGAAEECASAWAQGGIAAVLDAQDSIDEHLADTLVAGAGQCDAQAVRAILAAGRLLRAMPPRPGRPHGRPPAGPWDGTA